MQIDPEDVRRRYAELSDDALLAIARGELTELAQQYLDAELSARGLDSGDADPETSPEPVRGVDLVSVATFNTTSEADVARTLLRSAEIPAYLEGELGSPWADGGGQRILVPASFVEQAKEILESQISEEELIAQAEAAGELEEEDEIEEES